MLRPDLRLILASKSPRRAQLLTQAGIPFIVETLDVPEDYPEDMPVDEVAIYLAEKKAEGGRHLIEYDNDVLLTADSVVILDDVIYGKPEDYDDAVRILTQLSGRVHKVITGVCLLSRRRKVTTFGESLVHFLPLTRADIDYYIQKYQPYDKAGAYAVQEWIGLCKIARIEGTYSNIMGLPVDKVYEALLEMGGWEDGRTGGQGTGGRTGAGDGESR